MRRLWTIFALCSGLSLSLGFSLAQGVQGNVKLSGNATLAINGHSVTLTWNPNPNASSYKVFRGTAHGGPYQSIATGVAVTSYTDGQVSPGQTFYYVTAAVNGSSQSGYSNEVVATIP